MRKKVFSICLVACFVGAIDWIVFALLCPFKEAKIDILSHLLSLFFMLAAWVPLLLEKLFKIKFFFGLILFYQLFIFLSLIVGSQWQVYDLWLPLDKIIHFSSGILLTLFCFNLFSNGKNSVDTIWLFLICFCFSMMIGGVWEICEFVFDGLFGANAQKWQGFVGRDVLKDSMLDLVCDFAGSFVGGLCVVGVKKKDSYSIIMKSLKTK